MTSSEKAAVRDIAIGAFIVGMGLVSGKSIFFGYLGWLSVIVDLLGLFWLVTGLFKLYKEKRGGGQSGGNAA